MFVEIGLMPRLHRDREASFSAWQHLSTIEQSWIAKVLQNFSVYDYHESFREKRRVVSAS